MDKKYMQFKTDKMSVGDTYIGLDNDKWHIVSFLEDNGDLLVISKSWAKYKHRWVYDIKDLEIFCFGLHLRTFDEVKYKHKKSFYSINVGTVFAKF